MKTMKKNVFYTLIAMSAMVLFSACGNSNSNNNKSNETSSNEKDFSTLVSEGEFALAHKILQDKIRNADIRDHIDERKAKDIYAMADILYKDWILDVIYTNSDNPELVVSQLLMEYPILGEKKSGLQDYYYGSYSAYLSGISHFNQLCDKIFTTALTLKKYNVAEVVVNAYMEDAEVTMGTHSPYPVVDGHSIDGNHSYIKFSNKSQAAARKKLQEARR